METSRRDTSNNQNDSKDMHRSPGSRSMRPDPKNNAVLAISGTDDLKCANTELQSDVEYLILDYMNWAAMESLIEMGMSYVDGKRPDDAAIIYTVDATKRAELSALVFNKSHRDHPPTVLKALQLSRKLVRFTSLFVMRHICPRRNNQFYPRSSLEQLRQKECRRVEQWVKDHEDCSQNEQDLLNWYKLCRPRVDLNLTIQEDTASLRDILLPLMELIDFRSSIGSGDDHSNQRGSPASHRNSQSEDFSEEWHVTPLLQELLAEMMLQSVLEKYLDIGACRDHDIVSAFAWGPSSSEETGADTQSSDSYKFERVFPPERGGNDPEWHEIRLKYLMKLALPEQITSQTTISDPIKLTREHLQKVQDQHKRLDFEKRMIKFLETLLHAQSVPILVQLERGERIIVDNRELTMEEELTLRKIVQKSNQ